MQTNDRTRAFEIAITDAMPAMGGRPATRVLLLLLGLTRASALFTEMMPLKAAMLCKSWMGLLQEVDQKVGVVPELGSTSVGVQRFGPELERRTLCARQFERFYEQTFGLAVADKSGDPAAKREQLPSLDIAGAKRGPLCAVYASTASPATMLLVERSNGGGAWSLIALVVNPTERSIPTIVTAEQTALQELCALAAAAESELRVLADAKATLAGDAESLALTPLEAGEMWYLCAL